MAVIEPVPMEHLDPELTALIEHGRATRMMSSGVPARIWAYRPELAKQHIRRQIQLFDRNILGGRLMELVRLHMASFTECVSCQVARKSSDVSETDVSFLVLNDPRFTPREQAALQFAELFANDHMAIDDEIFRELARHFSKPEIVELGIYVASILSGGRLARAFRAYGNDEMPPVLRYENEFATAGELA